MKLSGDLATVGSCSATCPDRFVADSSNGKCIACHASCRRCLLESGSSGSANKCLSCLFNALLSIVDATANTGTCVTSCAVN